MVHIHVASTHIPWTAQAPPLDTVNRTTIQTGMDSYLQSSAPWAPDSGVQGLVAAGLGVGNVIIKLPMDGAPQLVHSRHQAVAALHSICQPRAPAVVHHHTQRPSVKDLLQPPNVCLVSSGILLGWEREKGHPETSCFQEPNPHPHKALLYCIMLCTHPTYVPPPNPATT
jgi:hypothetical protein